MISGLFFGGNGDLLYNTYMKNATVNHPDQMNEFEMILVDRYMQENRPTTLYTMTPGNNCIWVYFGNQNWYFIFRNGKIADIQID